MDRLLYALLIIVLVAACNSATTNPGDDPNLTWKGEQITTVKLTLVSGSDTVRATWADPDGINSIPASQVDTLVMQSGKKYTGTFQIYSTVSGQLVDITSIIADSAAHYVLTLFGLDSSKIVTFNTIDKDTNDVPTGLQLTVEPTTPGIQRTGVRLRSFDIIKDKKIGGGGSKTHLAVDFIVKVEA